MKELLGKERPTDLSWSKIENVFIDAPIFNLYEKAVILKLMRHAKEGENSAHPSKKTISLTTGISESKLRYVFRGLEEKGYLWAEGRKHVDGRCNSNIYYWDKEKILKDSLVSCLENSLIKESAVPRLWMREVSSKIHIKQDSTPHHMRGKKKKKKKTKMK